MNDVVEVTDLTKTFKNKLAVNQVSFNIQKGEVVALLGPNGAGKTTTLLMMLGLIQPTNGTVNVLNDSAQKRNVRERIGVMLQHVSLMEGLTASELLRLFRSYYPHPVPFKELCDITGLSTEDLNQRVEKLSGGQQQRVAFALALAGNPDVLFIDEPTVGMDSHSRKQFWEKINAFATKGKTILFSTHYLQEADDIAHRILLFNKGKIVADGSPSDIKDKLTKQFVSFKTTQYVSIDMIRNQPFVMDCTIENENITISTSDTDAVLDWIYKLGINPKNININRGRLEEAFEELITHDEGETI